MELLSLNDLSRVDEAIALLQGTVYSFSMKVCGHHEDAEDTMQEVLFKSIPYLAKIEDPRAMVVWLYTVTQNQCRMARRKSKFAQQGDRLLHQAVLQIPPIARLRLTTST